MVVKVKFLLTSKRANPCSRFITQLFYIFLWRRRSKGLYLLIFAAGFADNNHACGTWSVMFLAYIHGTKVHFFACATQSHPYFWRNSLIFNTRHAMAQKSDEVRRGLFSAPNMLYHSTICLEEGMLRIAFFELYFTIFLNKGVEQTCSLIYEVDESYIWCVKWKTILVRIFFYRRVRFSSLRIMILHKNTYFRYPNRILYWIFSVHLWTINYKSLNPHHNETPPIDFFTSCRFLS